MKWLLRIVGFLLLVVVIAAVVGAGYMFLVLPKSSAPEQITVTATPERLEHGSYLVNHVTGCVVCHSVRDKKIYSEPVVPGTEGEGSVFLTDPHLLSGYGDDVEIELGSADAESFFVSHAAEGLAGADEIRPIRLRR